MANAIITSVYGNLLRLRIPLTLRVINNEGETPVATDADFIPNAGYPVMVIFADNAKSHRYDAVMDGNVAGVEVKGDLPIGTWSLAILCRDEDGNPMRFAQSNVVKVVNYSAQAGLEPGIEFQGEIHVLDAAVYSVSGMIKGDPGEPGPAGPKGDKGDPGEPGADGRDGTDGVGIDDVTVTESQEAGGANTITIELTDGRVKTFTVLNGSGSDGGYEPPVGGIPKTDLAPAVQASLDLADSALQSQTQVDWNQTTTTAVDYIKNKPTIPSNVSDLTNDVGYTTNTGTVTGITMNGASKGTSGVVDLGTVITAHQDISGKANTADLATVATSGSYNDLSNKPTIPAAQVNSDWNASTGKAAILNKPTIPVGLANATTSEDGTWTMTLSNGEYITINLNHEHPQYVESNDLADVATTGSYNDLQDKPTIPSGVTVDSTIAQGGTNAVQGGAIYTALQDKANASEMAVSTSGDQTTITLKSGTSATVINQHQSLSGRVQSSDVTNIVVCASESAYNSISPKDSNTLYLIKE